MIGGSPLIALRDAIATAWAAATPPTSARYTSSAKYRHVDKPDDGAAGHREFYFRLQQGGGISEQGKGRYMMTHQMQAVLCLHLQERSKVEFDATYMEYQVLAGLMNTLALPAGVINAVQKGYFVQAPQTDDAADLELVIPIEAQTKETTT